MSRIYISGKASISPQQFSGDNLPDNFVQAGDETFMAREPDYSEIASPRALRRLSRIMKMSLYSSLKALKKANLGIPDYITGGTGYGCIEDTDRFLKSMVEQEEQLLSPTSFIQSTHNSITAQISLLLKTNCYNFTYVHRGNSFESALLDGILLLDENPDKKVLAGGVDEITNTSFTLLKRLKEASKVWKPPYFGEGSAFFVLEKAKSKRLPFIDHIELFTWNRKDNALDILKKVQQNTGYTPGSGTLILTGDFPGEAGDDFYLSLRNTESAGIACYKHLCGEYPTATSFGLYLALTALENGKLPDNLITRGAGNDFREILLINRFKNDISIMVTGK